MFLRLISIVLLLTSCTAHATPQPVAMAPIAQDEEDFSEEDFADWLDGFKIRAAKKGISQAVINSAFLNVQPLEKVISLDRKQPEHKQTMEEYLDNVINNARIEKGRLLMAENRGVLADITKRTGVEPEFIVALWGLESGFGQNTGDYSIIKALATLAYEGRRREFFEAELINALKIIEFQQIAPEDLRGSWAGAMGQCQFMPSSYLNYAVDYDGDGYMDIWTNKEDVMASIANYLATVGWGKDKAVKEKTLKHWNRSSYFVASVFMLAESIK